MSTVLELLPDAIQDAETARIALAGDLALSFARNPDTFDPRRLERLGQAGLGLFLQSIGEGGTAAARMRSTASWNAPPPDRCHSDAGRGADGWSDQRRGEYSYWLMGALAGVRAGGLILVAGAAGFVLAAHAVPVLKGAFI